MSGKNLKSTLRFSKKDLFNPKTKIYFEVTFLFAQITLNFDQYESINYRKQWPIRPKID